MSQSRRQEKRSSDCCIKDCFLNWKINSTNVAEKLKMQLLFTPRCKVLKYLELGNNSAKGSEAGIGFIASMVLEAQIEAHLPNDFLLS